MNIQAIMCCFIFVAVVCLCLIFFACLCNDIVQFLFL